MRALLAAVALMVLLVACQTQKEAARPPDTPEVSLEPAYGGPASPPSGLPLGPYLPAPPIRQVEELLGRLTLRQKIGQRLVTGFGGTSLEERTVRLLREAQVGGLLLLRANVENEGQVRKLTAALQETARGGQPGIGLFIAVDQEGGRVSRLDLQSVTRFPAPHYWTEQRDPYYVEAVAYVAAREALSLGCNMNFAPVLDLYARPDDTVIGDRSMGANPFQVGEQGVFYLLGARRAGIAAVVKHFPGHGRTTVDSHGELPVVDAAEAELLGGDLIPFELAIDHGVDAVMTAHLMMPRLDPKLPVTLSETIVRGLLRERLGFRGVVVSDDIQMGALKNNYSSRDILMYCIRAGVDLILDSGGFDPFVLVDEVVGLVESGQLSEELIDEGARRVLLLKQKYGLLPSQTRSGTPLQTGSGTPPQAAEGP
jgi:beta-N-acetylhexosaminidase